MSNTKQDKVKRKAFLAGADSYEEALPRELNPYKEGSRKYRSWAVGWLAAEILTPPIHTEMNELSKESLQSLEEATVVMDSISKKVADSKAAGLNFTEQIEELVEDVNKPAMAEVAEGYAGYWQGLSSVANPHIADTLLYRQWAKGWLAAKQGNDRRKQELNNE